MTVLTASIKSMLYCPNCSAEYDEGTQRFCTKDGSRLFPDSLSKSTNQSTGVFTNLLRKATSSAAQTEVKSELPPKSTETEKVQPVFRTFKTFKEGFETPLTSHAKDLPPEKKSEAPVVKTAPRLIRFDEVKVSQAKLGDRKVNPTGRLALSWENTAILLGQTIKGRYCVVDQLSLDETSIAYLAEDKLAAGRKVVVRVLMDEKEKANDLSNKIFAEERVSLSHINHPNIAALLDSGELLEGKPFIISEYVEGETLKEKLYKSKQLSSHRAARIIKQAADALSEAHANGILHRNLTARNIILSVSPTGVERVKVSDFAVFDGLDEPTEETIKYFSPEQLEGRFPNFTSDIYSLAVIAYQVLTGRFPFNFSTEKELLRAQKEGLSLHPTNLRLDLSPAIDEILEKALSYKASERYAKAREFGDAFYNALTSNVQVEKTSPLLAENFTLPVNDLSDAPLIETEKKEEPISAVKPEIIRGKILPVSDEKAAEIEELKPQTELTEEKEEEIFIPAQIKSEELNAGLISKNTTIEQKEHKGSSRLIYYVLGLLLLGAAGFAIWSYLSERGQQPSVNVQQNNVVINETDKADVSNLATSQTNSNTLLETHKPNVQENPGTQALENPPPNSLYFQNKKENLKGELAKKFSGFSFYYPNDWAKNPSQSNFVDVARIGATGTPIEQFLVSYYDSKGSFSADRENFSELAKQSNKDLMKSLGDSYKFLSAGETKINGNLPAYEMKFQAEGTTKNGDRIVLWGRRLWLPATKGDSGLVLTMLATSLSPDIKSADDIGNKGELASVLRTFEPGTTSNAN